MATLWELNSKNCRESFVSWCVVNEQIKLLISSERVLIIQRNSGNHVRDNLSLAKVGQCTCTARDNKHAIILELHETPPPPGVQQKPDRHITLHCNSSKTSLKIRQEIQYAIDLRTETLFTVNFEQKQNIR